MHLYLRKDNSVDFSGITYHIPNADVSPVVRIGYRLWKKYQAGERVSVAKQKNSEPLTVAPTKQHIILNSPYRLNTGITRK
jgi:hypothetical protein